MNLCDMMWMGSLLFLTYTHSFLMHVSFVENKERNRIDGKTKTFSPRDAFQLILLQILTFRSSSLFL